MKRDDVFFFTLIDFLVQVLFFGLVLYVLAQAELAEATKQVGNEQEVKKSLAKLGVSSLTELTDELTNLAPLKELKGQAEFLARHGGQDRIEKMVTVVQQEGGAEGLDNRLRKLRQFEQGAGKPHCLPAEVNGRKVGHPLATVIATEARIRFESSTAELETVLRAIGLSYDEVLDLPLQEFRKAFAPMKTRFPDCLHSLRFKEATRFVDARDSAGGLFYLQIERQR